MGDYDLVKYKLVGGTSQLAWALKKYFILVVLILYIMSYLGMS